MRERILAIVHILAEYALQNSPNISDRDMIQELLEEGYDAEEIDAAFYWLENLKTQLGTQPVFGIPSSFRVFTSEETHLIPSEARGFLIQLRSLGILDDTLLENIIEKSLQMADDGISLKEVKALTTLVLFNRLQGDSLADLDFLLDDDWTRLFH